MTSDERKAADALIARAMTVEASKLYAVLHYRAELSEYLRAGDE